MAIRISLYIYCHNTLQSTAMVFNSMAFVYFFIVVTSIYFLLPHKFRWLWLLAASCYFYMYFIPVYILILGFTIIIDYFAGIFIAKNTGKRRKNWLVLSLIANVGILAFFKYYNFLNDNIGEMLGVFHYNNPIPYLNILLPLGLSFHTFQAMSYTIEVYRGRQQPERHFGIYALYVMFYPQLVAGPIERPQNVIHQFYEKKYFDYERVVDGLKIMMWGFIKKIVIANRIALYVDVVYMNTNRHSGLTLWMAGFLFVIQIYCDFSGYSDIALGAAKVMGYNLMVNFRRPFCAGSVQEVWQRWHISLMTWFRDYVLFSLKKNRKKPLVRARNLLIVFGLSGLWHGANWTYLIWGIYNGVLLIVEQTFAPAIRYTNKKFGWLKFAFRAILTWIFFIVGEGIFRAANMKQSWQIITAMFTMKPGKLFFGVPSYQLLYAFIGVVLLLVNDFTEEYFPNIKVIRNKNVVIRYAGYTFLIVLLLMIGVFDGSQFIYFQF